jgi:ferredoxin-NADP reductase/(2Fe-2S) ferredoxin
MQSVTQTHHYDIHVFCCINERAPGHPRGSCSARGAQALQAYMKAQGKALGLGSRVRMNKSGCLERCELGPTLVIYPEGVWYTYNSEADIDEILHRHVLGGEYVERLLLEPGQTRPRPTDLPRLALKVADVSATAPDVKRFVLHSADGSDLPTYDAGAHIDLFTDSGLRRSYSLVGDPVDRGQYVLGVRREENSRGGSSWVFDQLSTNSEVTASVPRNSFTLATDAKTHTLIAGGIGITPILAMGYELKAHTEDYHLHYCTPSEAETPFLEEVRSVFGPRVTFHHDGGDPSKGLNVEALLADRVAGQHIYVCGPVGLVESVRLHSSHWPEETFHSELFAVEPAPDDLLNEAFDIFLSRQKMTLSVPPDRSILEVVREADVVVEASCEDGLCSCCRTRLLGGEPDHRDHVLSSAEKLANESIMICVSRAAEGETLILDL